MDKPGGTQTSVPPSFALGGVSLAEEKNLRRGGNFLGKADVLPEEGKNSGGKGWKPERIL